MSFTCRTLFTLIITSLIGICSAIALPANQIGAQHDVVFNPPITYPIAAVQWAKGTEQIVRWETKDIPPQWNDNTGMIVLGFWGNYSENLDIDHPLASNFSITSGEQAVRVPENIPCGEHYFIVLFGDSGNRSPTFQIL